MTDLLEIVSRLEEAGGRLTLDGERIRYAIPRGDAEALSLVAELRKRKPEVAAFLKMRTAIPAMPSGVRLIEWNLKEPPEPIIPTQADCGCAGPVCPRCWLCGEHCHCLPRGNCWHCAGDGRCDCATCHHGFGERPAAGPCVVCQGSGRITGRV